MCRFPCSNRRIFLIKLPNTKGLPAAASVRHLNLSADLSQGIRVSDLGCRMSDFHIVVEFSTTRMAHTSFRSLSSAHRNRLL